MPLRGRKGTRKTLAQLFNDLGYKNGAEVGVGRGRNSAVLCKTIPGLKLKCIDPWEAFYQASQDIMDGIYENAHARLDRFGCELIRKRSLDAVKDFEDSSLDFVYIDGLHEFDNVMRDLINWIPKVREGGIVSGHDYMVSPRCGVVRAVDVYTQVHNVPLWYITNPDPASSWFWVR